MDNVFITQYFDWQQPETRRVRLANAVLARLGLNARLASPGRTGHMTSVEQRINMYHLVSHVLVAGVPGALVEVGCHAGSSAALFQKVVDQYDPARELHVYDSFEQAPPDELVRNFAAIGLRVPTLHAGLFRDTLPGRLPEPIAFAHVDIGPGRSPGEFEADLRLILEALYPRLSRGAVCLMMDYCDPQVYQRHDFRLPPVARDSKLWHLYPQVKRACDAFLAGKPETVTALYAGGHSHGFFRKV